MTQRRWDTIKLLVWKNWTLQKRRPVGTCCEIGIPAFFAFVLFMLRMYAITSTDEPVTKYPAMPLVVSDPFWTVMGASDSYTPSFLQSKDTTYDTIAYYPANDAVVNEVMQTVEASVRGLLPTGTRLTFVGLDYEAQLDEMVANNTRVFAGITFKTAGLPAKGDATTGTHDMGYQLRLPTDIPSTTRRENWMTEVNFPEWERIAPRRWSRIPYFSPDSPENGNENYPTIRANGFLQIQASVDQALAKYYSASGMFPQTTPRIESYPYPAYEADGFLNIIAGLVPFFLVISFLYSVMSITRRLVNEKETRMKEAMRMMGLPNWINWTSHFLKDFSFLLISVALMTFLFHAGGVFKYSSTLLILVMLLLFATNVITFSYWMSSMFSGSSTAAISSFFLWFMFYQPYGFVAENYADLGYSEKAGLCLCAPSCIAITSRIVSQFESRGDGIQWSNLYDEPSEGDNFTAGTALGWLMFDSILYLSFCLYIENVFPGQYGNPQGWFFFLSKEYWLGREADGHGSAEISDVASLFTADYEQLPAGQPIGVSIKNMSKVWSTPAGEKTAVDNLNLDVTQDEVTVLLGQNGAGKTTSMNIMVGMYPPTQGSVTINGRSVITDTKAARESLGLCPQFDILFDDLTVEEHLYFFSRLKGSADRTQIAAETEAFIADVELKEKAETRSKYLSGGQKRALSVALGFVGGSKTVILDEPTSGMDPYKRRATWELIQKHKVGRTVLLTTHFMDEADLLGDRIAVMRDGKLRCVGSSLFLKDRFGCGYHMTVQKKSGGATPPIQNTVQRHVTDAVMEQDIGNALVFQLPKSASAKFAGLFAELESNDALQIESCGASVTTMEDVFLKINSSSEIALSDDATRLEDVAGAPETGLLMPDASSNMELAVGFTLLWMQFKAMLVKRLMTFMRNKRTFVAQVLIPIIFVALAIIVAKYGAERPAEQEKCRAFNSNAYGRSPSYVAAQYIDFDTPFNTTNVTGFAASAPNNAWLSDLTSDTIPAEVAALKAQAEAFLGTNNLAAALTYTGVANTTQSLIDASKDFKQNQFFRKHPASFSFGPGAIWVDGQCQVRVSDAYTNMSDSGGLTLQGGVRYSFVSFPYDYTDVEKLKALNFRQTDGMAFGMDMETMKYKDQFPAATATVSAWAYGAVGTTGTVDCETYNSRSSIAITFTADAATAFKSSGVNANALFNRQAFHASGEALNMLGNIILQETLGNNGVSIPIANCPLPKSTDRLADEETSDPSISFGLGNLMALGLSIFLAAVTLFPVNEKQMLSKHIQFVSGVDVRIYWLGSFASDLLLGLIPGVAFLIVFAAFEIEEFEDAYGELFLLNLLFNWMAIPLVYCLTFLFDKSSTAFAVTAVVFWLFSLAMVITMFILPQLNGGEYEKSGLIDDLRYTFYSFNPVYAYVQAVIDIYTNSRLLKFCARQPSYSNFCDELDRPPQTDYLSRDGLGVGVPVLFMLFGGVVYFALLMGIEALQNVQFSLFSKGTAAVGPANEDDDVIAERERINHDPPITKDTVTCKALGKTYGTGKVAVNQVSFGVPPGEIFGLLGVNGAGKSTTFKMLTGETGIGRGGATINGKDIATEMTAARRSIGYCPQYDGLIPYMTGRELLTMFARLRGVPDTAMADVVSRSIAFLELGAHCDRLAGTYSGGNKRKLSTAIALVGKPNVLFLDEPTTGMDPGARRSLWNALLKTARSGKSIVLTSHSMEECEALCTKLAIMVNGEFQCFGTTQHLKSKFAQGYSLIVKLKGGAQPQSPGAFLQVLQSKVQVQVKHEHGVQLDLSVSQSEKMSDLFAVMESAEVQACIDDYGLSQTSLEQVFLGFAKKQHGDEQTKDAGGSGGCACTPCACCTPGSK